MQCTNEDGRYAKTEERRKAVPEVSSLTTCDELREARSEIKRVPENSRGSARSNYLHEAQELTVESTFFLRLFFISPPRISFLSPSHFLRVAFVVRYGRARGTEGAGGQRELFWITFYARLWRAIVKKKNEKRDVELTKLSMRRINYTEDLRKVWDEQRGKNLISLASEFLSKSRVNRLI